MLENIISQFRTLYGVCSHMFRRYAKRGPMYEVVGKKKLWETVQYPEEMPYLAPRFRGRIVLTRDPDGEERCVACNLCASVCPPDCIALQKTEAGDGRWYPEFFRINFSRCMMCGLCEEACPTYAIQLTPEFEMGEYHRENLIYEKEHLLIDGQGKYPGYSFYNVAGKSIAGKDKGDGDGEAPPVDIHSLLP